MTFVGEDAAEMESSPKEYTTQGRARGGQTSEESGSSSGAIGAAAKALEEVAPASSATGNHGKRLRVQQQKMVTAVGG